MFGAAYKYGKQEERGEKRRLWGKGYGAMEEDRRRLHPVVLLGLSDPPKASSLRITELKPWISDSQSCSKGSGKLIVYLVVQTCFRIEHFLLVVGSVSEWSQADVCLSHSRRIQSLQSYGLQTHFLSPIAVISVALTRTREWGFQEANFKENHQRSILKNSCLYQTAILFSAGER